MKTCPFCHDQFGTGSDKCPSCGMLIVERIPVPRKVDLTPRSEDVVREKPPFSALSASKRIFLKTLKATKAWLRALWGFFRFSPLAGIMLVAIVVLPIAGALGVNKNNDAVFIPAVFTGHLNEAKQPEKNNSLPNWTVINRVDDASGQGILKIDNWTPYDAVLKLVNIRTKPAQVEVYVRKFDAIEIDGIPDGEYELNYCSWTDWLSDREGFSRRNACKKFDERLFYLAASDKSVSYSATLNAVAHGNATTSDIDPRSFLSY